jgi:hypothetical protein
MIAAVQQSGILRGKEREMKVRLFDSGGQHVRTFCIGERDFDRWLDDLADQFFETGGSAEVCNDREINFLDLAVQTRHELRKQIRVLAM